MAWQKPWQRVNWGMVWLCLNTSLDMCEWCYRKECCERDSRIIWKNVRCGLKKWSWSKHLRQREMSCLPKACGENSLNAICTSLPQLQSSYHWYNQSCEVLMKDNNWPKTLHFALVLQMTHGLWTMYSVWLSTMLCDKRNGFLAFACFPWTQETAQFPHTWGSRPLCRNIYQETVKWFC
jgi:hypothetical protein